jgi:hypothetical protein
MAPWVAVAVYLALVVPFVPRAVRAPGHVARMVATNDTAYDVSVEVVDGQGLIPVGSVGPDRTATFREVADVGARWTLVWSSRGREVRTTTTRTALDRSGWEVAVPDELGDALTAAGEPPTP